MFPRKYTRFEKARIIGARALQISMGAPVLIELKENTTDPIDIALLEFEKDAIPITVLRKLPSEKGAPAS
ncbi:MAG: DNA-directed RNA polymerase subunit K [Hadesarchaea archaeon CG08_land_8_20_14_0_20_51_8]|nr:MAG: DNA-directed RNA polymerase subunit K [Hadesarchaea archaeon CG08_land_8_20_14_0_20_51_8]